jgi:hypothetical protein
MIPRLFSLPRLDRKTCRKAIVTVLAAAGLSGLGGCLVATVVSGAGSLAVTTVSTAGKVAGATLVAGGRVASSAITASADVTDASVKAAAKLSKDGMVVFFDPRTGAVWQAPWSEGLKLLVASQTAQIGAALQVVRIVRNAQVLAV